MVAPRLTGVCFAGQTGQIIQEGGVRCGTKEFRMKNSRGERKKLGEQEKRRVVVQRENKTTRLVRLGCQPLKIVARCAALPAQNRWAHDYRMEKIK